MKTNFFSGGSVDSNLREQIVSRLRECAHNLMADKCVSLPGTASCFAAVCVALTSCALPMNDTLGKQAYQAWAPAPKPGATPLSFLPSEPTTKAERDAFIFHMKEVKDYEYDNYVLNLRRGTSWGEAGSDSVKLILDSLVAVTGNASTKAALGAASAGVTGASTSIKKNVLFDQTITTFITTMDAMRLNKWNDILCKMGRKGAGADCVAVTDYTVAEAFNDLQEYGRDGTLDAALRGIAKNANTAKETAQTTNDKLGGTKQ